MKKAPVATAKRLNSPRQNRALLALRQGPQTVRDLFRVAGCTGVPQLIASLRRKGLVIITEDRQGKDRDGRAVWFGIYSLSPESEELADQLTAGYRKGAS